MKKREEAVIELIRMAQEHGIHLLIFETEEEMKRIIDDMRTGARIRETCKAMSIKLPAEYLM